MATNSTVVAADASHEALRFLPMTSSSTSSVVLFGALLGAVFALLVFYVITVILKRFSYRRHLRRHLIESPGFPYHVVLLTHGDLCPTCHICVRDFDQNANVRLLQCGHVFHNVCIGTWFSTRWTCPACRFDFRRLVPFHWNPLELLRD